MKPRSLQTCGGACPIGLEETDPVEVRRTTRAWWGIGVGAVLAGNSMMLGLAINTSEASPAVRLIVHTVLLTAALVTLLMLGEPLLTAAWEALRQRRVTIEAMFLTGLTGAMTASLISMFTGRGAVYFETVIVLMVVYSLGNQVTRQSQRRALRSIQGWQGAPETCEVLRADGSTQAVAVEKVGVGDSVRVHPGRMIPIDGTIIDGEAYVQQSQLTGEFFSVARGPGQAVYAGSHCVDGTLSVRATSPGNQRRIDHLARAVEKAQANPSALETEADRIVRWFLPIVLTVATLTFIGWSFLAGWRVGLFNAMAVLLVACPCAMGFATPVSIWSAIGRLASSGLVLHRGNMVEALAGVDTVVFDKTGTLTQPQASLIDLVFAPEDDLRPDELRRMIAAVQRASDHPVAAAFHALDASATGVAPVRVEAIHPLPGRGLEAECLMAEVAGGVKDYRLRIGSELLLESADVRAAWEALAAGLRGPESARRIAVLVDGRPVAAALIDEKILETGPATLEAIEAMGLRRILMTGDRPERAEAFGIAETHAGLSPEEKQALVRQMGERGQRVLFIGDGVNDAIAMAESPASIALATGASLALETAGAVLMEADLTRVPFAILLCRRARRTIRTNLRLAACYNAAGMALACAGVLHPVAAAILMTCSSLVVTWRSLRLLEDEGENALLAGEAPGLRAGVATALATD